MLYIAKTAIDGTTFEIPDTVTTLDARLIDIYPQIKEVYIPASVTSIKPGFLYSNANITNIKIDSNNQNYLSENGMIYNKDKKVLYLYYLDKETIDISKEEIKTIEEAAFRKCKSLKTIILPETLENINYESFRELYNLNSVTIGKNVKYIHPRAFLFSQNITNMTIDSENANYVVENNAIFNKDKTEMIVLLRGVTEYTIPEGVEIIGDYAFYYHRKLTQINIPNTVKRIGEVAIASCTGLTQIVIPSSVEKIASNCFNDSNKLEKIIVHKAKGSISGSPWGCLIGERAVEWKP